MADSTKGDPAADHGGPPESEVSGAQFLAALRAKTGLSQGAVATRADISRSMLAQLEAAERKPSRKLLTRLAVALQLTPEEEHQLDVAFGFTPEADTPEQIAAFLRADKHLDPHQAEQLANLVREAYHRALQEGGAVKLPYAPEDLQSKN